MADLTVTLDQVRVLDTSQRSTTNAIADEAVTRGQPVYEKTNGRVAKARANAVTTAKACGIALNDANAGEPVTYGDDVRLAGFNLSAVDNGTTVYLSSATAGMVADAAATGTGNVVVPLGAVKTATGSGRFKYIRFFISPAFVPVAL
jgi:hypothetical protein